MRLVRLQEDDDSRYILRDSTEKESTTRVLQVKIQTDFFTLHDAAAFIQSNLRLEGR